MSNLKTHSLLPNMPWAADNVWKPKLSSFIIASLAMSAIGIGDGLIVISQMGLTPWTVLSQGISLQTGMNIGLATGITSCVIMLFWIPLNLKLGLGTFLNIILIALFLGITLYFLPPIDNMIMRVISLLTGIIIFGFSTALYLTCKLGAGPRDGLMVGLCQKFGWKIIYVRTAIEATVCFTGYMMGGNVGIGTILFALSVGYVIQLTLKLIIKLTQ